MAFESDLIRRYSGAFSKDDCLKIIKGIKFFEDNHLLFYDRTYLTSEDHKVVNVSHDYDFSASSRIGNEILPKVAVVSPIALIAIKNPFRHVTNQSLNFILNVSFTCRRP